MAFVVAEERKKVEWVPIAIGFLVVALVGGGVYTLFFSESPLIDTLTKQEESDLQTSAVELGKVQRQVSPENFLNNPLFRSLKNQVAPMQVGETGKANPFQTF